MQLHILHRTFLTKLKKIYNLNETTIITNRVFNQILGINNSEIIINPLKEIETSICDSILEKLALLIQHEPIQYVLGNTNFLNIRLQLNKNVLIPRPETEELVQLIIDENKNKIIRVLDIGTGSGCIAITLKKYLPKIEIIAIDISIKALEIAQQNANENSTSIQFKNIDFLNETLWKDLPKFDIIVSNPPYIPINEKVKMDKNVIDYEPHHALFVPDNTPLIFYQNILKFALTHLNKKGKIYLETHENFAKEVANIFVANCTSVTIKKDMFDKERFVMVQF